MDSNMQIAHVWRECYGVRRGRMMGLYFNRRSGGSMVCSLSTIFLKTQGT